MWAQQSIVGVVLDPGKTPVAGIPVQLQGPSAQTALTSASGEFRFDGVNLGAHQIFIAVEGFEPLRVKAAQGRRLNLNLKLAARRDRIDVDEAPSRLSLETGENASAISVERGLLDNLPSLDLDLVATLGRFMDGGAAAAGGGTQLIVDGVEARNVGVTPSAIQEIKINNNPYAAEYPRWSRRRIEILTKSGVDKFHGTVNFVFRDYHFNARDAYAATRPQEQRKIFEGSLLGPLGSGKKTSFLLSGMRENEQLQAVVNAVGPSGPVQENVAAPQFNTHGSVRVNHAFSDKHAVFGQVNYQDRWLNNQGVGGLVTERAGVHSRFREDEFVFNHRAVLSSNTLSQFRFLLGRYWAPMDSNSAMPKVSVSDAIVFGGAQADRLSTEFHTAITWMMAHTRGRHSLKFGINVPDWSRRGLSDRTNQLGSLFFASLADLEVNRPYSGVRQAGDPRVIFVEKNIGGFISDEYQVRPGISINAGLRYDWQNYFGDRNNIQPRLAVAWAPRGQRKWIIRAGSGIFYERSGPNPIFDILRFNGVQLRRFVLSGADIGRPLDQLPSAIDRLHPQVQLPGIMQYSLALERQLSRKSILSVQYTGVHGWHYFRSRDANAPEPSTGFAFRPDPTVGQFRQIESAARWRGDSFDVMLRGDIAPRVSGMIMYAWVKMRTDGLGLNGFPAASYDPQGEFSRADSDRRHRFTALGTASLHRWANFGFGVEASTGAPFNLTTGSDQNRDGMALDRPAGLARNQGDGPGLFQVDLRWYRDFPVRPSMRDQSPKVQISVDSFNIFNRLNARTYLGALSSPFFGQAVASLPARRIQFGCRFQF